MGLLQKIEKWSASHQPVWLVLPRIALGIILFIKGIIFIRNIVGLENLLSDNSMAFASSWLPLLITWLHLICGVLIIIGLLTRWVTLIMIPILLVAVIFINAPKGLFAADSEFGFSLAILLILIFFFIEGGGPLSLDSYLKENPK